MSGEAVLTRAKAQITGPINQRCMLWKVSLNTAAQSEGFLADHSPELCQLMFATLPVYRDRASVNAVLVTLRTALDHPTFLKAFASLFCRSLASAKVSAALASPPDTIVTTAQWAAILLPALQAHPDLADAATGKVLSAIGVGITVLYEGAYPPRQAAVATRKLSAALRRHPRIREVALEQCAASSVAGPVAAALCADATDKQAHEAAVKAYLSGVVGSKEKLADALVRSWGGVVRRMTVDDFHAALDKLSLMIKRSADTALSNTVNLFSTCTCDLSAAVPAIADMLLPLLRHSKDTVVARAVVLVPAIAARVFEATALEAFALSLVTTLTGSGPGGKLKSSKERVVFANAAGALVAAAGDLRALKRLQGPLPASSMRVAAALATHLPNEAATDVKCAVLASLEAWLLLANSRSVFFDGDENRPCHERERVDEVVKALADTVKTKEGEIYRGSLRAAAALALGAGSALEPLVGPALKAARDGHSKAALRTEAALGIVIASAASAGDAVDGSANDVCELCRGDVAGDVLSPNALATVAPGTGVYVAAAAPHLVALGSPHCAASLAVISLSNDSVARLTMTAMLRKVVHAPGGTALAASVLSELWKLLEAFPQIPGTQARMVGPGAEAEWSGSKVVAARVLTAVEALLSVAVGDRELTVAVLKTLHHPVCITGRGRARALAIRPLQRGSVCAPGQEAVVADAVTELLKPLDLRSSLASSSSDHAAAQCGVAAALALLPDAVWPVSIERLQKLLDPSDLLELRDNDVRIYDTPRGTLMMEKFQSMLSPDELFEARSALPAAPAGGATTRTTQRASSRKVSKEEQQRQDRLEAEEQVRLHVIGVRKQLQLGCGLLVRAAQGSPASIAANVDALVPLVTPLFRRQLVAETPRDDPVATEPGAFAALVALASCLPLRAGAASMIASALQVAADPRHGLSIAHHPAVTNAVALLKRFVDNSGALTAQAYALVFPIVQRILGMPNQSPLHADCLDILAAHVPTVAQSALPDHIRLLNHLVTVAAGYSTDVRNQLTALYQRVSTQDDIDAFALGLMLPTETARMAVLQAADAADLCDDDHAAAPLLRQPGPLSALYVVVRDSDKDVATIAAQLWERAGEEFDTGTEAFVDAVLLHLCNDSADVRAAAARALCTAVSPRTELVSRASASIMGAYGDSDNGSMPSAAQRAGCAAAIRELSPVLPDGASVLKLMKFVLERGLTDDRTDVQALYVEAGSALVNAHGASQLQELMPLIDRYLENDGTFSEELYDQVRTGAVVFLSGMAQHLPKEDPKIGQIVAILKEILCTPSEAVQRTASDALTPIAPKLSADEAQVSDLVKYFLDGTTGGETYGVRRGAAFGLAGLVKGLGIAVLKKQGIMDAIKTAVDAKSEPIAKEGGLLAIECLCAKLGRMFEPYIITVLPMLLTAFGDTSPAVREAASDAARAIMANLTAPGVKLVLPTLLKGLQERQWRSKQASIQLLGAMSNCAPQQLSAALPSVVPALAGVLGDAHPKVQAAAEEAIGLVGDAVRNPEVKEVSGVLIKAIADPVRATRPALEALRDTVFVHTVDVSSLALMMPIVARGLKERTGEAKKYAARILGNLASLVNSPRDLTPYMPAVMPELKNALVDPLPEVRATSARALGSLVRGLGQTHVEEMMPWLLTTLSSEASSVERSGAALALAEVVAVLGAEYLAAIVPGIISGCHDRSAAVRDGNLTLLVHLPVTCKRTFEAHLESTLPCVLEGLADEAEEVRNTAMAAASKVVDLYAVTRTPLLLPVLEVGVTNDNWRIRESSVKLLGELLYKICGTSGKVKLDGDSDEEGAATEHYAVALLETLGMETRNDVLARVYLVRCDASYAVRQAAVHVWKSVVVNTPKTLREVLPRLMDISIEALSGDGEDGQATASKCLGELVRKMGDKVLAVIVPTLVTAMADTESSAVREGICLGMREVLDGMTRDQIAHYLPDLMPVIQTALCDPDEGVRAAAGDAFGVLFRGGAGSTVEGMLPSLVENLATPSKAQQSIKGLQVILSVRPALLDRLLPKLLALPVKQHYVAAVGPLIAEAPAHLREHLPFAIPRLLNLPATQAHDPELRAACHDAALSAAMAATEPAAVSELVKLLTKFLDDAACRGPAAAVLRDWVATTPADIDIHRPMLISSTLELLGEAVEEYPETLATVWQAAKAVIMTIPKPELPGYVSTVRKALSTAYDQGRRSVEVGEEVTVAGLCLPKGLEPVVEIYLQGLLQGTTMDVREAAAAALGEAVAATSLTALKPFIIKITGPLIRIVGDRFPPSVKAAILRTLGVIISKAGIGLKPFVPQLQTTFVKCLPDTTEDIRMQAAKNLGSLATLMVSRVDQLAQDLVSQAASVETHLKASYLTALRGVLANASARLTSASLPTISDTLRSLVESTTGDDEELQVALAACIGEYAGIAPADDAKSMLQSTALRDPLPPAAGPATICATALPVLCRHHADRLQDLGLLDAGVAAAERCMRHKEYAVKVAAVRTFGRLTAWALQAGCRDRVRGLISVAQSALAPDQDRALQAEAVHNLKALAALEHPDGDALVDELLRELLPALCAAVGAATGTALVTTERCLAHLLRVHHGIAHARELASAPGMGASVKGMLTEPYLRKLASMPLTSAFDATVTEDY